MCHLKKTEEAEQVEVKTLKNRREKKSCKDVTQDLRNVPDPSTVH